MNKPFFPLAALACLSALTLLPSCVQWNIGGNIRECAETRLGADLRECYEVPADADVSTWPRGTAKAWHYLAPEVRYRPDYPLVRFDGSTLPRAREVKRTGGFRKVTGFITIKRNGGVSVGGRREAPPDTLKRAECAGAGCGLGGDFPIRAASPREAERSAWYPAAVVAAAPFDYLIDPALSLVSTPVAWIGALATLPFHQARKEVPATLPAERTGRSLQ